MAGKKLEIANKSSDIGITSTTANENLADASIVVASSRMVVYISDYKKNLLYIPQYISSINKLVLSLHI